MKLKMLLGGIALTTLLASTGCDNNNDVFLPPDDSSTSRVTALASVSTEDGEPFAINDGAFEFNDTSDQTDSTALP